MFCPDPPIQMRQCCRFSRQPSMVVDRKPLITRRTMMMLKQFPAIVSLFIDMLWNDNKIQILKHCAVFLRLRNSEARNNEESVSIRIILLGVSNQLFLCTASQLRGRHSQAEKSVNIYSSFFEKRSFCIWSNKIVAFWQSEDGTSKV